MKKKKDKFTKRFAFYATQKEVLKREKKIFQVSKVPYFKKQYQKYI